MFFGLKLNGNKCSNDEINSIQVYQHYMENVLANDEGFFDTSDVIKRYDALVAMELKLHEQGEVKQERLIAKKAQLARCVSNFVCCFFIKHKL